MTRKDSSSADLMAQASFINRASTPGLAVLTWVLILYGLYASTRYSYLLFHSLAELFSILAAFLIFVLVWNTRHVLENRYLQFIGIASLFTGVLNAIHTLAYEEMGVFPGYDENLSAQSWVAFRAMFSFSFLLAPLFANRKTQPEKIFIGCLLIAVALICAIAAGYFPVCYAEGKGPTSFKILSEYFISTVFLLALGYLYKVRSLFNAGIFRLIAAALLSSAAAELSFTHYVGAFGNAGVAGHFFELLAYYLIYRAIAVAGIAEPSGLLFRHLKQSEEKIRHSEEKYRSLVELSPDALLVHSEGKIVYINPAGVKLYGARDAGELAGRNISDLIHPAFRDSTGEPVCQSCSERVQVPLREVKIIRLDETPVYAEAASTPVVYSEKPAAQVVVRDITERKRAEKELQKANEELEVRVHERTRELRSAVDRLREEIEERLRTERELKTAKEKLQTTLESIADAFFTLDRRWRFTHANSAALRMFRKDRDELLGKCIREISPDRACSIFYGQYARVVKEGVSVAFEALTPLLNKWVEVRAFPDGDGLSVFIHDITERKETERRIRQSEARYRILVEDVRDIIFTLAPDGIILSLSRAFETISGWPASDWIGKHFSGLIHPEEVLYAAGIFRQHERRKGLPLFELRGLTRSGEYRYFEFKITTGRSEAGNILGIARDVTERKQTEEDRARLFSAVQSAADAVVITAPSTGVIQYVNPAFEQMTGYAREESLGRTLHFLESGKHDGEYYAGLRESLMQHGFWKGKLNNKKKNGDLYFEECTVSPVRNRYGEIINYVYVKRDVTEKLRLESIAEAVNTMNNIGYVFSGISHEIGNPVSSLMVTLELLKEKLYESPRETIAGYADRALSQVAKMEYLLDSLRTFNIYETRDIGPVRMAPFLDQFLSLVSGDFTKRGILIRASVSGDAESACADPRALQQVMLNLFTNAADALQNRDNPKIEILVSRTPGIICIRVADNGRGMTAEHQSRLFQPFFTTKPHGTGLGMVIVKNMLTTMNGTINIESRMNGGTTVVITLPESTGKQRPQEEDPGH